MEIMKAYLSRWRLLTWSTARTNACLWNQRLAHDTKLVLFVALDQSLTPHSVITSTVRKSRAKMYKLRRGGTYMNTEVLQFAYTAATGAPGWINSANSAGNKILQKSSKSTLSFSSQTSLLISILSSKHKEQLPHHELVQDVAFCTELPCIEILPWHAEYT